MTMKSVPNTPGPVSEGDPREGVAVRPPGTTPAGPYEDTRTPAPSPTYPMPPTSPMPYDDATTVARGPAHDPAHDTAHDSAHDPVHELVHAAVAGRSLDEVLDLIGLLEQSQQPAGPGLADEAIRTAAKERSVDDVSRLVARLHRPPHDPHAVEEALRAAATGRPVDELVQLIGQLGQQQRQRQQEQPQRQEPRHLADEADEANDPLPARPSPPSPR
ncbi:hypothetical protein OK074_7589, partial [Actinobacteria bacterium OK074]